MKKREIEFRLHVASFFANHQERFENKFKHRLLDQTLRDDIKWDFEHGLSEHGIKVKCDQENNPPEVVDMNTVIITVSKQYPDSTWIYLDIPIRG